MVDANVSQTEPDEPQVIVEDTPAAEPDDAKPAGEGGEAAAKDKAPPEPPKFFKDDKRLDIYEQIEARKQQLKEFDGNSQDPDLLYGRDTAETMEGEEKGDPEVEALEREAKDKAKQAEADEIAEATGDQKPPEDDQKGAPAAPAATGQTIKVKVDGQEREVPVEELVNNYQMNSAADRRLAEAKSIIEQARELQASKQSPGTPTGTGADHSAEQDQPHAGKAQADPADLEALYERVAETLQMGDTKEASQALRDLVSSVATQPSPKEIAATAAFQVRMDEEHRRSETALREFIEKNEAIRDNPQLQSVGINFLDQEMVADFEAAGASQESIAARIRTPLDIRALHRAGRAMGVPGFRPLNDILPVALEKTKGWANQTLGAFQPANPPPSQTSERQERVKRVAPQPAQRAGPPARPAPQRETTASIVEETRRMRGLGR